MKIAEQDESGNLAKILIMAFNGFVDDSHESTMQGFLQNLKDGIDYFFDNIVGHQVLLNRSVLTLRAVTELYIYSITKSIRDLKSMERIKEQMKELGDRLIVNFTSAKDRIFNFSLQIFKTDDVSSIESFGKGVF